MPFIEELHYFYLYMRDHIGNLHHMDCERGDAQVLTVPILEKITAYNWKADVIVADCTGKESKRHLRARNRSCAGEECNSHNKGFGIRGCHRRSALRVY